MHRGSNDFIFSVGLHYELEVEFECISCLGGRLLKLEEVVLNGASPISDLEDSGACSGPASPSSPQPVIFSPSRRSSGSPPSSVIVRSFSENSPTMSFSLKQPESTPFIVINGPLQVSHSWHFPCNSHSVVIGAKRYHGYLVCVISIDLPRCTAGRQPVCGQKL